MCTFYDEPSTKMRKNSRLVYSTDSGRIKPLDKNPPHKDQGDGIVRIRRETKGRGGKAVCVITGLPIADLKRLNKLLKSKCATGGAIKDDCIEIQGDHRERLKTLLESEGFQTKLSGG